MAVTLTDDGTKKFSQVSAQEIEKLALINSSGTVISNKVTSFSWGTPTTSGIDLSSNVDFTVNSGGVVAGVKFYAADLPGPIEVPLGEATFTSTYSFPDGGTFELTSLNTLVSV